MSSIIFLACCRLFLCSCLAGRSFVPACRCTGAPRARTVKVGRRDKLATCTLFAGHTLTFLSTARQSSSSGRIGFDALERAPLVENCPGDAGELVGERDRQHIVVQSLFGCLDPRSEPVALPSLRLDLDQDDPGGLNEQRAQVAIATP